MSEPLKAPFPWFGGKSKVANLVWERFGNVPNYVEPFFGSGAVLLARPHAPEFETINDIDCYVANFWRALKHEPEEVARWADNPVNEADKEARHVWLVSQENFRRQMKSDPDYYDTKIAGYWVWGLCIWIGAGWCAQEMPDQVQRQIPVLTSQQGIFRTSIHRQMPHMGGGRGVLRKTLDYREGLMAYMLRLAERLSKVRVCCGDWERICGPAPTTTLGVTGVFLDPPYSQPERSDVYKHEDYSAAARAREWAIQNGGNPDLRIALCGYEGEHDMPYDWETVRWKANGGYANQGEGRGRENAVRERIWFSPHCEHPQESLFHMSVSGDWLYDEAEA